jgi:heptosyltransferase-1
MLAAAFPMATDITFQRLLVVRLGAMGDIVHTLPAATALRNAFPHATIGWVAEERWAELLCTLSTPRSGPRSPQRPLVDRIHTINSRIWRRALFSTQTWEQIAAAISAVRSVDYEVVVDFQGAIRSALIARISGVPVVCGPAQAWESPASMFYSRPAMVPRTHVVEQNMALAEAVARRPLALPPVMFPCDEMAEQDCERSLRDRRLREFVMLSPGAGWGAKQWPATSYAAVARRLAQDGLKSLINFGPGEAGLASAVEEASNGTAERVVCSLTQMIALTRRARLFIGGDSGPLHVAAAMRIPVVGIFGPTSPARNGPFATSSIVLRSASSVTSHARRAEPEPGLLEITPEQVVDAAHELLRKHDG